MPLRDALQDKIVLSVAAGMPFAAYEELLAPGYEGINGLNISNAIHLSDWTGKPQDVPVDKELFLKLLDERRATSHVKEAKDDGKIADLSGTYNDRWKVR